MNYVLDILRERLRAERIAWAEAVNAIDTFNLKADDEQAFKESKRLAEERIPQLNKAIKACEFMGPNKNDIAGADKLFGIPNRHNEIELLEAYSKFLERQGYIDTDWRAEEPFAIDEFFKEQKQATQ